MKTVLITLIFSIILMTSFPLFSQSSIFSLENYINFLENHRNMSSAQVLAMYPAGTFKSQITPATGNALYYDTICSKYSLTNYEKSLVTRNGFMVSERLKFPTFLSACADIYSKDLPVFISTDAILHTLHLSYDAILLDLEGNYLIPKVQLLLNSIQTEIAGLNSQYGSDSVIAVSLKDLDYYNTVARKLFDANAVPYYSSNNTKINETLQFITAKQPVMYSLFGEPLHLIDFSQFTLRGHYADDQNLLRYPLIGKYFMAMIWLGRTEIPLVPAGDSLIHTVNTMRSCIMANLLTKATLSTQAYSAYNEINNLLNFLVGNQDNVTVKNLIVLFSKANISSPLQLKDSQQLFAFQDTLLSDPFAFQLINSQLLITDPFSPTTTKPASAAMLLGQRFVIDSYITSQVVFDRIIYNNQKIKRMLPNTLDVLGGLGNNGAIQLIKDELNAYHYGTNLSATRYLIEGYENSFWNGNLFHRWINSLRKLNPPANRDFLPEFMQTAAFWQQKMNTQLASWTQLRHDNILYAKQSYTSGWVCSFPYGYVEPFPNFYSDLSDFALFFKGIIEPLSFNSPGTKSLMLDWCDRFKTVNDTLTSIAKKELAGQNLSGNEMTFLRNFLKVDHLQYGSPYNGWFYKLFYAPEDLMQKKQYVVADIHTSRQDENGNVVGWIKHVGTGNVNLGVVTAKDPSGVNVAYVGPFLSYYDYTTTNFLRLNDEDWAASYLSQAARPSFVNIYLADSMGNTRGSGLSLLTSAKDPKTSVEDIPEDFKLSQNYPNPFNSSTIITFSIPSKNTGSYTELSIFNIQGVLIKKLVAEPLQSGNYTVSWEGNDNTGKTVASGIYFYRLKSSDKILTGKMTLLK